MSKNKKKPHKREIKENILVSFSKKHRVILYILTGLLITSYIINFFVPSHTITMAGEYIFSFDYFGHVKNILFDRRSLEALDNTNCFDCPDFYHYSRWYSLFKIGYQIFSQILHLHPFVFYILSMLVTQLVSLYIFVKVLFKKFHWGAFLLASFLFIFYPYKYSLIVETHDGLLYSNMLLFFTLNYFSFKNITLFSFKKSILFGTLSGFIFSFFFNIDIAFAPIAIYILLILSLIFYKKLWESIKKSVLFGVTFLLPVGIINIPLFSSIIRYGDTRHYEGYISFSYIDGFLAGLQTADTNFYIISLFTLLFLFCFYYAPISWRNKIYLLLFYLLISAMILGINSPINIYDWMFNYLPLVGSLRATHRYMFFELVIFFIITYLTLVRLESEKKISKKILLSLVSFLVISLPLVHIYQHKDYLFINTLPDEYFQAQAYLNKLDGDKIYFPPTTKLFHDITTDYSWVPKPYTKSILLYKNPYTSLLPISNLVQFERFPYLLSTRFLELRYLTELSLSPQDIIKAMELRKISYVIVDKNYKWKENYPQFDIDAFIKLAKIKKRVGNIYILQLSDQSNQCKKGYGTISLDYCTSYDNHTALHNKTQEEFLLETKPYQIAQPFFMPKNSIYTKSILDPILFQTFIDKQILFSTGIMQLFGNQKNVFYTKQLEKGNYMVYLSLFRYPSKNKLFGDATLVIHTSKDTLKRINPYSDNIGLRWEKIAIPLQNPDEISIDIENKGYVILGNLPLLRKVK